MNLVLFEPNRAIPMLSEVWYAISGFGVCVGVYAIGRKIWRFIHSDLETLTIKSPEPLMMAI
jgi:hypothetical protein